MGVFSGRVCGLAWMVIVTAFWFVSWGRTEMAFSAVEAGPWPERRQSGEPVAMLPTGVGAGSRMALISSEVRGSGRV